MTGPYELIHGVRLPLAVAAVFDRMLSEETS